jgi:hypothetical protein
MRFHPPVRFGLQEICLTGFLCLVYVVVSGCLFSPAFADGGFSDWAAIVVAGDWHAHDGSASEIFDNARHDVTEDLVHLGFARDNIEQFSIRPRRYPADSPIFADAQSIADGLWDLSGRTHSGCLVYLTSHGAPSGLVLGNTILEPVTLARMLNNSCADRPTVVIVSACFSGVFVPALRAANRMILTAARPDRTSFGCGQADRYNYFDQCVLSSWPDVDDFPGLARAVRACVAAREVKEQVSPPSEPQFWLGAEAAKDLPNWR